MATLTRELQDDNAPTVSERIAAFVLVGSTVNTGSGQLSDQVETRHDLTRLPQDLSGLADQILTSDIFVSRLQDDLSFSDSLARARIYIQQHSDALTFADQILTGDVPTRGLTDSFTFADQINTALLTPHAHIRIYQIGEEIVS